MDAELQQREISHTTRWGIGIVLTILIQFGAIVWSGAKLDAQVQQNKTDIEQLSSRLDQGAAISISREQLDDILGSRDTQLEALERAVTRIEQKIDRLAN